jgi:rod shape-determining protein MreC
MRNPASCTPFASDPMGAAYNDSVEGSEQGLTFPIKSWMLLVAVLLLQLLLMAYQLRQHGDVPLFRFGINALVTPVQKGLNATIAAAGAVWHGYLDLRGAREESERLTGEKNRLHMEILSLQQEAAVGRRLRSFFDLGLEMPGEAVVARVISISASETSKMIVINKGHEDGIEVDAAVMVPDGIVGKVLYVYPSSAQVLLITDPFSGVAGMLEVSRTHGIVKGKNTALCSMNYVPTGLVIAAKERVLTSGVDTIFPKGLPIGVVERSLPGVSFQQIALRPAASLSSLEEVIVFRKTAVESMNEKLTSQ